jgi:hypothetical protein
MAGDQFETEAIERATELRRSYSKTALAIREPFFVYYRAYAVCEKIPKIRGFSNSAA